MKNLGFTSVVFVRLILCVSFVFASVTSYGQASSTFVPSLYGYSVGANSFYKNQLSQFCNWPTTPGSASEMDYSYFMYTINRKMLNDPNRGPEVLSQEVTELLNCARRSGKVRMILRFDFYEYDVVGNKIYPYQKNHLCRTNGYKPISAANPCYDVVDRLGNIEKRGYEELNLSKAFHLINNFMAITPALGSTFEGSGLSVLAGLTLSEENVTWDYAHIPETNSYERRPRRRSYVLGLLYNRLREEADKDSVLQNVKFLQWYSPHRRPNYPGGVFKGQTHSEWPVIDSDGWVFDQYRLKVTSDLFPVDNNLLNSQYFDYLLKMKELGKPLYSIVFASPLRFPSGSDRDLNYDWWNPTVYEDPVSGYSGNGGWINYYGQSVLNKYFKIPTMYYSYTPVNSADISMLNIEGNCGVDMFNDFLLGWESMEAMNLIRLEYPDPLPMVLPVPGERPSWIPAAPDLCDHDNVE